MTDTTKLSNIYPSLTVKINVRDEFPKTEIGKVIIVHSKVDNPNGIEVSIDGGIIGNVVEVLNSPEIVKDKILNETHYIENKDCFTEPVMKNEVIPKTIQSFLNSCGGSLFIGVNDDAKTIEEKIIGLKFDRDHYEEESNGSMSDDKFKDKLRSELEQSLDANLSSKTRLGPLLDYEWHNIDGKIILEIIIPSSKNPIFYKHIQRSGKKKGKHVEFAVGVTQNNNFQMHDQRQLDDFYIRDGSRKILITTFEEFTAYYCDHFI
jgi:predicted HTH transcriptional regulator